MIVDCHGHLTAPPQLAEYRAWLLKTAGARGRGRLDIAEADVRAAMNEVGDLAFSHLDGLARMGIDVQFLSARPMLMMHSQKPADVVQWFAEASNDLVHMHTKIWPGKFIGIAALPQIAGEPVDRAVEELRRCVLDLGFKGCILNPDPYENTGPDSPPLWDRSWYPLYEALCDLDVPCHIHATGRPGKREIHNHYYIDEESVAVLGFASSEVLDDFPDLKVVISHGGGSIPYQIGRYEPSEARRNGRGFLDRLRRLHFDTVLHHPDAVEYLIKIVGADRCLYGTEWPGLGSVLDPGTGRTSDDLAAHISAIPWLSAEDKNKILCDNARSLFNLGRELATDVRRHF